MSGRLTPLAGLICDDIRVEAGGGLSFMGVPPAGLAFSGFPARRLLQVVVFFRPESTGECTVTTSLRWKDEVRWSVETELAIEELGGCVPVVMGNTLAGFDRPGLLSLEVSCGDEIRQVATWDVSESEENTGVKEAEPQP